MDGTKRVLIVDDDENLCFLLSAGLRLKGWNPESVGNFGSAVAAVQKGFEVVLLDLGLPDSEPMKTIRDLYRLKELGGRRVYIITGAPINNELRNLCTESGAEGVISKNAHDFTLGLKSVFGE